MRLFFNVEFEMRVLCSLRLEAKYNGTIRQYRYTNIFRVIPRVDGSDFENRRTAKILRIHKK